MPWAVQQPIIHREERIPARSPLYLTSTGIYVRVKTKEWIYAISDAKPLSRLRREGSRERGVAVR